MRVESNTVNTAIFTGEKETAKDTQNVKKEQPDNSIYGGSLDLCSKTVEERKKQAKSMAMKLAQTVFSNEKNTDKDVEQRKIHIKELKAQKAECQETIDSIPEQQKKLKEQYGVSDDSEEESDLALLKKREESKVHLNIKLTDEEKERLQKIDEAPLTSYQQESMQLYWASKEYNSNMEDIDKAINEEAGILRGVKIERLKSHDMVDANKQGAAIMAAASDEVIGMLIEEAKDKVDETADDQKEEAKEKKEEEEKLQEKIETAKEQKDKYKKDDHDEMYELDNILEEVKKKDPQDTTPDVKKSLNQIVNELKLTVDDVKGAAVDEQL